jgi:hypothetical protein
LIEVLIYFARFFKTEATTTMMIIADIAAITANATSKGNAVNGCGIGD